jgi:SAM-dependent methyltransferase
MSGVDSGRPPADFGALDFERLWRGREKTTAVEAEVLRRALGEIDTARVLEIGPGGGRLSPVVAAAASELVALDLTRPFVDRLDRRWAMPPTGFRVAANVGRLPFADSSFSSAVMIRVYNFLPDPESALREIGRVLRPGGHLVFSYEPKPSLGTLAGDVRSGLRPHDGPVRSQTFARADRVPVRPSAFPAWSSTRGRIARTLVTAGFTIEEEVGTGLEDFPPFRWLPATALVPMGIALGASVGGVFPSRFLRARAAARAAGAGTLAPLDSILACPRCRVRFGPLDLGRDRELVCVGCGCRALYSDAVLDAVVPGADSRPTSAGAG